MTEDINSIDSKVYNDVRFSYSFNDNVNAYIGVTNLFDEQPAHLGSNQKYQQQGTTTNGTAFDLVGRAYYAGIKLDF